MHIPLWQEGWKNVFTCGCPDWGSANDPYWEIERREKWAEKQSPSTFAFRQAVLSTPNLAGVMTGHLHTLYASSEKGKFLFTVPANRKGDFFDVTFTGA
jgi:hypothetical protein